MLGVWLAFREQFEEAVNHAYETSPEGALGEILLGMALPYGIRVDGVLKGVFVIKAIQYPAHRTLLIWLLVGSKHVIWGEDVLAYIERLKVDMECEGIEAWVRPGIRRYLSRHGFYEATTKMVK